MIIGAFLMILRHCSYVSLCLYYQSGVDASPVLYENRGSAPHSSEFALCWISFGPAVVLVVRVVVVDMVFLWLLLLLLFLVGKWWW